MTKFRVTYPSGEAEEVEQSDCDSIEQFANTKFGYADYESHGVKVEIIDEAKEVKQEPSVSSVEVESQAQPVKGNSLGSKEAAE